MSWKMGLTTQNGARRLQDEYHYGWGRKIGCRNTPWQIPVWGGIGDH